MDRKFYRSKTRKFDPKVLLVVFRTSGQLRGGSVWFKRIAGSVQGFGVELK